jgi:16S rRNA (cytidine1402-2'-O)-methyltransferase
LLRRLGEGEDIALVSDAGTPLISDPGFHLVRSARAAGIRVVPVPGPSALVAALSVSGLPTDRFVFEGFLPARQAGRVRRLKELAGELRTLVFYESSHRIRESLGDMVDAFGPDREATLARELTKTFETVLSGPLGSLHLQVTEDPDQQKGEFVVLVHGAAAEPGGPGDAARRVLEILLAELPLKQAASLAAKLTGIPKNRLYDLGLELKRG